MVSDDLVSVIIPAYNSRKYICETIDSVINQTYKHVEIIVVDDGSSDGTAELIKSTYGEKICVISQSNAGPAIARNRGIETAKGDYIKFLDADDKLHPTYLERCMDVFASTPENVGIVYTRYRDIDREGNLLTEQSNIAILNGDIFCEVLLSNGNAILTSTVITRRKALDTVGYFPNDPTFRHGEDWDLFLRLAHDYHYIGLDDVLVDYRTHEANLVRDNMGNAKGRLRVIENAQQLSRTRDCLSDEHYHKLLAGRYHILAVAHWKLNQRQAAREAFQQAIRIAPHSVTLRRVYIVMTYIFPASVMFTFNRIIQRVRGLR